MGHLTLDRRWLITAAITVTAVVALLALPSADAQEPVTVTYDGPIASGALLTLTCPDGYRVVGGNAAPQASATFYRAKGHKGVIATNVPPSSTTTNSDAEVISATWLPPRGTKYATASLQCEPIPVAETTTTTAAPAA